VNGFQALNIFVGSMVFTTALSFFSKSPNRVRNAKISGAILGVLVVITVGFLISAS
jgi:hypothetical protein